MSPSSRPSLIRDASFERLYRRHRRDVYGAVLRDVRDPDEAEDVTQIAFLNAFRAIRRGEQPDKPRAWLVTIAKNVVRRRYRGLATRPQEVALDPEVAPDLVDLDGPTAGEIAAAIRRLPPNQRAVILLREIQGRSYAEIADELELSLPAVETLIFRARRNLSEELRLADHVPATRTRRAGRLRSLFALPGLGKLSLGFSFGRAGMAAFVGGVAIMTVPVGDVGSGPPAAPAAPRSPALAEQGGPPATPTALAPKTEAAQTDGHKRAHDESPVEDSAKDTGSGSGATDIVGTVIAGTDLTGALPTLSDPLPVTTSVLPPLPVEPPALPPPPPPPDLDLLP